MKISLVVAIGTAIVAMSCSILGAQDTGAKNVRACKWPAIGLSLATKEEADEKTNDSETDFKELPVPWKLLDFEYSTKRKITEIRLIWFKFETFGGRLVPDVFDVTSTNSDVLHNIQMGLDYATRHAPEREGIGAMGDLPLGQLQVCTTDGAFIVAIHKYAFGLDSPFVNSANTFWSWAVAKQIDELYFRQMGKHLPEETIEDLSGEKQTKLQKREYHQQKPAPKQGD